MPSIKRKGKKRKCEKLEIRINQFQYKVKRAL